ncbi:MAG: ABC-F type ribosomal protection protein [Erysipelotrichaceae bacterium]|nr:ABC-F type ribosomal protection protein [Erysipelotrichaceae bacterium]
MLYQINKGTKYFGANLIFENIQFEVKNTEKIAIVGRNGAGKTTLLKAITDEEVLDFGQIHKSNDLNIGYLAQTTFTDINKTVMDELLTLFSSVIELKNEIDNIIVLMKDDHSDKILERYAFLQEQFERNNGYNYQIEIKTVFMKFGFDEEDLFRPLSTFSGGQKTRIAFVKLLLSKPDILLLDEPTNHLDLQTIQWLESYLKTYPKAVILVSHDRVFLDAIANVVYELEYTKLTKYIGNYTEYSNQKKIQLEKQEIAYKNQQQEIERLEALIEKFRYKKNKAAFAQSKIKYLDRMEKIQLDKLDKRNFHAHFQPRIKGGRRVLVLDQFTIGYDHPLCTVNLEVMAKDRIAIMGANGTGKSTLIKSIVNKLRPLSGAALFGHQIEIGYFDQELAQIDSAKTVLEELWDDNPQLDKTSIRTTLGNFMFSNDDVFKQVQVLSGGEKVRLSLAKLMLRKANLLLLDEPTNHLDILGKEALEDALMDYEGTIIFVSHDRYFIKKIATSILLIEDNTATYYPFNYQEFILQQENATCDQVKRIKTQSNKVDNKNKEKKDHLKLEKQIAEKETELENLRNKRFEPEFYHDYQKMQELDDMIDDVHNQIECLMALWEESYQ